MKFLNNLYQHINILSLDVAAGAVVSSMFFGRLLNVIVPYNALITLAITVWIIYTLDHLRDAMTITKIASTDRHRFHQKHFRTMVAIVVLAGIADLILVYSLPVQVLTGGLVLGLVVIIYLIFQRFLKFLKEFFVACLYTSGILLPPLAMADFHAMPLDFLIFGKFFITALMNLLLFSLIDYNEDRDHQQHSFVTWFGPQSTRYGIISLGLLNILSGLWLWGSNGGVALVFISMNAILLMILFFRKELAVNNYYRILGDAVFFIPGLYLL